MEGGQKKNGGASVANFEVKTAELLRHLNKKLDKQRDGPMVEVLGVNATTLSTWRGDGVKLSALQVANLVMKARRQAKEHLRQSAIKPIVEFFPIEATYLGAAEKSLVVFDIKNNPGKHRLGLYDALVKAKSGLYIFYDTRGKALYAGQTKKQNIWKEMNLAFNRPRSTQVMTLVKHPTRDVEFRAANEKVRQPTDQRLRLHDLAAYFSAYEVVEEMVDDLEALLVRAFPNDLLNFKMEKFGKELSAKRKALKRKANLGSVVAKKAPKSRAAANSPTSRGARDKRSI